jgi:hypothetical protein
MNKTKLVPNKTGIKHTKKGRRTGLDVKIIISLLQYKVNREGK